MVFWEMRVGGAEVALAGVSAAPVLRFHTRLPVDMKKRVVAAALAASKLLLLNFGTGSTGPVCS